jgi:Leucine-rich repeat (LRR) protein
MKTLQSGFDSSQLAIAKNLAIHCSDQLLFESHLTSEHFGELPNLEELSITSCKIRHVPAKAFLGLANLKKLSLRSDSATTMDIDVESLKKVNSLEDVHFSSNNIWSLPSGMMCELLSMKLLNMSSNHLLEASNLGLSTCRIPLLHLDLSRNFISSLNKEDLSPMPSLETLDLSHNQINSVFEDAFLAVLRLKRVDLSHNQLSALPANLFNSSLNLEMLNLQNNSLVSLHPTLLTGLTSLQVLNLSFNSLNSHQLSRETFSSLASLHTLDLSFNQMSKIGSDVFSSLTSLQFLFVANNLIQKIDGAALANQLKLKTIDMSQNKLTSLPDKLFLQLGNLLVLKMDENLIEDLNNVTFKCANVLEVSLAGNVLTSVPAFIKNCNSVTSIDLSKNKIVKITNGSLSELTHLNQLNLSHNKLECLENNSFSTVNTTSNIQFLDLSNNKLSKIEQAAFKGLDNLTVLNLNENLLDDLNGILSHLATLEWLNISTNKVEWFDLAFLPSSMAMLDLSNNMIADLSNFYNLQNFRLKSLDASRNFLSRIGPECFPKSLVHIRLDANKISEIDPSSISHLDNLEHLDLRLNKIEHLASEALTTSYNNVNGKSTMLCNALLKEIFDPFPPVHDSY